MPTGSWISPIHLRSIGSPTTVTNTWIQLTWSGTNVVGGSLQMKLVNAGTSTDITTGLNLAASPYVTSAASFNDVNLRVVAMIDSGTSTTTPQLYWYTLSYQPNTLGNRAGGLVASLSGGSFTL